MRTSSMQFQLLVEYMEKHGDLSKPSEGPRGRLANGKRWDELAQLLNSDSTGDTKTSDKWRKVWSDFKNNSKKKAARIHRAAQGTGGGPASNLKLTELEERALLLVGNRAATGFTNISEIGIEDEINAPPPPESETINIDSQLLPEISFAPENWNRAGSSREPALFQCPAPESEATGTAGASSVVQETALHVGRSDAEQTAGAPPGHGSPPSLASTVLLSDVEHRHHASQSPTPLPATPRRRRRARMQEMTSPIRRRTRTQTQSDLARQAFVRSDCEWRSFQQETERERNRLRELELRRQDKFLDILQGFLVVFKRIADSLENRK